MTAESALIVPVPDAEPVVADIRFRSDPAAPAGIPAHITVLYPFIEPDRLDTSLRSELESIFRGVTSFRFELAEIRRFPGVIYLAPVPADGFKRLTAAVATRWPDTPPYGGIYEEIVPHLTVAHDLDETGGAEVVAALEACLPVACSATEVLLMTGREGVWTLQERFPFSLEGP